MVKFWLLRFHRWLAVAFALPLAVLVLTGLVLSFEPIAQTSGLRPGSLTPAALDGFLATHDPEGRARGLSLRPYEDRLTISGVGPEGAVDIDVSTGAVREDDGRFSGLFGEARGLHEHLVFDLGWLVTASTFAMLALAVLGIAMGWPRLRASMSGWHQGIAWFALPLLVLSPLTGLALALGVSFAAPAARTQPLPLREAARIVALAKDPSTIVWIRNRGGRQLARLNEGGMFNVYAVTREGLVETPRNWPRLIHEGNFAGIWSGLMNVAVSLAFVGLMVTGGVIFARRQLRRRQRRRPVGRQPIPA